MRLKFIATTLAAAIAATSISFPASAQQQQTRNWLPVGTVATPFVIGAAMGGSATSFTWTTIATQTWNFPWHYNLSYSGKFIPIPNLNTNIVQQGVNAKLQYVSNVLNPKYFNETLTLTAPNNPLHAQNTVGQHSTSAQYKQHHQKGGTSNKTIGKVMVGCIFGSALAVITASMRKATAMGNPPRWRSQAEHEAIVRSGYEKQFELTSEEANIAIALCGLGSFALHWPQRP